LISIETILFFDVSGALSASGDGTLVFLKFKVREQNANGSKTYF